MNNGTMNLPPTASLKELQKKVQGIATMEKQSELDNEIDDPAGKGLVEDVKTRGDFHANSSANNNNNASSVLGGSHQGLSILDGSYQGINIESTNNGTNSTEDFIMDSSVQWDEPDLEVVPGFDLRGDFDFDLGFDFTENKNRIVNALRSMNGEATPPSCPRKLVGPNLPGSTPTPLSSGPTSASVPHANVREANVLDDPVLGFDLDGLFTYGFIMDSVCDFNLSESKGTENNNNLNNATGIMTLKAPQAPHPHLPQSDPRILVNPNGNVRENDIDTASRSMTSEAPSPSPPPPSSDLVPNRNVRENHAIASRNMTSVAPPPSYPSTIVPNANIREKDVLFFTSGQSQKKGHPGNANFRRQLNSLFPRYDNSDKNGKSFLSGEIYKSTIADGGRFLKQTKTAGQVHGEALWYEMSSRKARSEIGSRFRQVRAQRKRNLDAP